MALCWQWFFLWCLCLSYPFQCGCCDGYFPICQICRSCSPSFWISFRGNCSIVAVDSVCSWEEVIWIRTLRYSTCYITIAAHVEKTLNCNFLQNHLKMYNENITGLYLSYNEWLKFTFWTEYNFILYWDSSSSWNPSWTSDSCVHLHGGHSIKSVAYYISTKLPVVYCISFR